MAPGAPPQAWRSKFHWKCPQPRRIVPSIHLNVASVMELNFNCPQCSQELTADESMLGVEIECPSCGEAVMIEGEPAEQAYDQQYDEGALDSAPSEPRAPIAIPTSAASADMIKKPKAKRLEVAAKEEMEVLSKTILYSSVGKDAAKYDEAIAQAMVEIGRPHIISTHTVNPGEGDFGLTIIYERQP